MTFTFTSDAPLATVIFTGVGDETGAVVNT
jgi:hypothetical protein